MLTSEYGILTGVRSVEKGGFTAFRTPPPPVGFFVKDLTNKAISGLYCHALGQPLNCVAVPLLVGPSKPSQSVCFRQIWVLFPKTFRQI